METTKRIIIVLILALFTAGPAISDETELSGTTTASCLIKITSNPAILPLEDHIIEHLLRSTGVAGKAAREILETPLSEEALNEALQIEWLADEVDTISSRDSGDPPREEEPYMNPEHRILMEMAPEEAIMREMMGMEEMEARMARSRSRRSYGRRMFSESSNITSEQMILLRIVVNLEEDNIGWAIKPAAVEFMHALIINLGDTINNAFQAYENRYENRLNLANEQANEAEEELRRIQEVLKEISGSRILDRDRILDNIADLRHELQVIEMSRATDGATTETIVRQINQIQARSKEQLANDAIINEIERIIELKSPEVEEERKQVEGGLKVRESYLAETEEKMARLRIELAQRKNELSISSGGHLIESLNSELADRSIESAQNEAKLRIILEQLEEKEELLDRANEYELMSLRADIAKDNLREAIVWRDRLSRQIRMLQEPMVSVLGLDL